MFARIVKPIFLIISSMALFFSSCRGGAATGGFSIFRGEKDGHPLFAMVDTTPHDNKFKSTYPWFLNITTSLTNPTKDGLTTDKEASDVNDWEDSLEKQFSGTCRFVYVGRVTWNGTRQLLYYVDASDSIEAKLSKLADRHPARAFSVQAERDEQ
jgi:Family of unknown function (DUF695)